MTCLHKLYNILILLRAFVTSEEFFSVDKEHQLPRCGHFVLGPQRSTSSQSSLANDNAQYSGLSERLIYVQDNITLTGYTKHSTVKSVKTSGERMNSNGFSMIPKIVNNVLIGKLVSKKGRKKTSVSCFCFLISLHTA